MQCVSCGTEFSTVTAFCTECGAAMPHNATEPAAAAMYPPPPNESPADLDKQHPSDLPNPQESTPSRQAPPSKIKQGIGVLLLGLFLGFITWLTISRFKENPEIPLRFRIRGPRFLRGARLAGLVFALVGLIFCIVALVMFISTLHSLQGTVTGQGQIVSCAMQSNSSSDQSGSDMCQPTVRFTTASGQVVEFVSSTSSNTFHEGDQVSVQYHPDHPQDALISSFMSLWFLPILFGGLGSVFLVVGVVIILRS